MSKSKSKTPPRRLPCSEADVKRARTEGREEGLRLRIDLGQLDELPLGAVVGAVYIEDCIDKVVILDQDSAKELLEMAEDILK